MHVSFVGDSRSVVGVTHKTTPVTAMPLTMDHKPDDPDEKKRISRAGGEVRKDPDDVYPRVYQKGKTYPGLNMSRSIGDIFAQTLGVSAVPVTKLFTLSDKHEFIIVASDGVWEFLTNIDVVRMVAKYGKEGV